MDSGAFTAMEAAFTGAWEASTRGWERFRGGGMGASHGGLGMGGFHGGVARGAGAFHGPVTFAHPGFSIHGLALAHSSTVPSSSNGDLLTGAFFPTVTGSQVR